MHYSYLWMQVIHLQFRSLDLYSGLISHYQHTPKRVFCKRVFCIIRKDFSYYKHTSERVFTLKACTRKDLMNTPDQYCPVNSHVIIIPLHHKTMNYYRIKPFHNFFVSIVCYIAVFATLWYLLHCIIAEMRRSL